MKPEAWPPAPGGTPFEKLGGAEKIGQLVEHFYDFMERDEPALAALHKMDAPGRISREIRDNFASFLCFWLGGERHYIEKRGHPMLRARHAPFVVDVAMRDAWLRSMTAAMDKMGIEGEIRAFLDGRFNHVADFLRNVEE